MTSARKALIIRTTGAAKLIGRGLLANLELDTKQLVADIVAAVNSAPNPLFLDFGGLFIEGNTALRAVTSTPSDVVGWAGVMPSGVDVEADAVAGTLSPETCKTYMAVFHASIGTMMPETYKFQMFIDGVAVPSTIATPMLTPPEEVQTSFASFIQIHEGQKASLKVSSSSPADLLIKDAQLLIWKVV